MFIGWKQKVCRTGEFVGLLCAYVRDRINDYQTTTSLIWKRHTVNAYSKATLDCVKINQNGATRNNFIYVYNWPNTFEYLPETTCLYALETIEMFGYAFNIETCLKSFDYKKIISFKEWSKCSYGNMPNSHSLILIVEY